MYVFFNKLKNNRIVKYIWLTYAIISLLIVLVVGDYVLSGSKESYSIMSIKDNWNIKINDIEYTDITLDDFSFESLSIGDKIIMTTTVPTEWDYNNAIMAYSTKHSTVDIYIDDEHIYAYGHDRKDAGKTVGSGLLYINMNNDYKGKILSIHLNVTEDYAFSSLDNVIIAEWHDLYQHIVTTNRLPMFLGFFLIIFGTIIVFLSGIATTFSLDYIQMFWLAKFSFCIGIWTLCYYNCVIIFSIPLYSISLMENVSLLLSPIPILGYMTSYVKQLNKKSYTILFYILFIFQICFSVTFLTLHGMDRLHIVTIIPYFHIMVIIDLLFLTKVILRTVRYKLLSKNTIFIMYMAPLFIVIFVGYDLILYIFDRYLGIKLPMFPGLTTLGVVIFLAILVIDLWNKATEQKMEEQEKKLLIKLAYVDGLTLINNRRFCSEYMEKLKNETADYTIFNFDLNGLKQTNDSLGHIKGDILIKKAAQVIDDAFGKEGIVGRMGGDEFIAIIKTTDTNIIEQLINNFLASIEATNNTDDSINLSISYGYACSNEVEDATDVEKVYNMADSRMYNFKKNTKKLTTK